MTDSPQPVPSRRLPESEREELLALDIPARLATLEADGFPRITTLWFLWADGAIYMTSVPGGRHLENLERDNRAAICIDVEEGQANTDGVRPNRQIKARGQVELFEDADGEWTRRITMKYVPGEVGRQVCPRAGHKSSTARAMRK